MFESVQPAAPDPIFGLTKLFRADSNPEKINLAAGIYQDNFGKTPALECVQQAVRRIADRAVDRQYLPIDGNSRYNEAIAEVLLGADHPAIADQRYCTIQTLGGTSALKVAADTIFSLFGKKKIWFSDPTWGNHLHIFGSAGHETDSYPWIDQSRTALDFDRLTESLNQIPSGDVIVLHGCCHNPTGVDPTPEQWKTIKEIVQQRGLLTIFDIAYQGFAESLEADASIIRQFCESSDDLMICNSFSKNFSLYNERVGGLTITSGNSQICQNILSHVKRSVRGNYSNPPHQGAAIVAEVLADEQLKSLWVSELETMRSRIIEMRAAFYKRMSELLPNADFSFVIAQRGMFSFTGLNPDQVDRLRDQYSIYLLKSGRINLAGLSNDNVERVCKAIASVAN